MLRLESEGTCGAEKGENRFGRGKRNCSRMEKNELAITTILYIYIARMLGGLGEGDPKGTKWKS